VDPGAIRERIQWHREEVSAVGMTAPLLAGPDLRPRQGPGAGRARAVLDRGRRASGGASAPRRWRRRTAGPIRPTASVRPPASTRT